jgi:catechol 2,3-dioxygenase-like lactoylglutathione lyase family enzyme
MGKASIAGISPFFIVSDAEKSIAFYRDTLRSSVTYEQPDFAVLRRDAAQLFLKEIGQETPPLPNPQRHPWAKWDAYVSTCEPDALADEISAQWSTFPRKLVRHHRRAARLRNIERRLLRMPRRVTMHCGRNGRQGLLLR